MAARAPRNVAPDTRIDEDQLAKVIDALYAVESGQPPESELPDATASWFLDRAHHFRAVAFGALRLIEHLTRDGDDRLRAKAARALAAFVPLYPARVEEQLLRLAATSSPEVRYAVVGTLAHLIEESVDPEETVESFASESEQARELVKLAQRRLALQPRELGARR